MRVKRSDQITSAAIAYLQSVNGYFKVSICGVFPMECHRRRAALICSQRSEFFLIANAFSASFQCKRRGLAVRRWLPT